MSSVNASSASGSDSQSGDAHAKKLASVQFVVGSDAFTDTDSAMKVWGVLRERAIEPALSGSSDLLSFHDACIYFAAAVLPPENDSKETSEETVWIRKSPLLGCFVCNMIFTNRVNLMAHLRRHCQVPEEGCYPCPLVDDESCDFLAASLTLLDGHLETTHFQDRQEDAGFQRLAFQSVNMANSTETSPQPPPKMVTEPSLAFNGSQYECYLCHEKYLRHSDLEDHLAVSWHGSSSNLPQECPGEFCSFKTHTISLLIQHIESGVCGAQRFSEPVTFVAGAAPSAAPPDDDVGMAHDHDVQLDGNRPLGFINTFKEDGVASSQSNDVPPFHDSSDDMPGWRKKVTESKPTILGFVYLTATTPGEVTIGVAINSQHQRQGIGAKAVEHALQRAFDDMNFHRVQACVVEHPDKYSTLNLLTKFGFQYEGTRRRSHSTATGEWVDVAYLGMLDTDWANRAYRKKAGKSLWDQMLERHERERDELLDWDDSTSYSTTLKRTASTETLRVGPSRRPHLADVGPLLTDGEAYPSESEPPSESEAASSVGDDGEHDENARSLPGLVIPSGRSRSQDPESSEDELEYLSDAESDFSIVAPSIASISSSASDIPMSEYSDTESQWDLMESGSERARSPLESDN